MWLQVVIERNEVDFKKVIFVREMSGHVLHEDIAFLAVRPSARLTRGSFTPKIFESLWR